MSKKILLLSFLLLIFPFQTFAQSREASPAAGTPQVRNMLQLLTNPGASDIHFRRFQKRVTALINRLKRINRRIETRISKITASKIVIARLTGQSNKFNTDLIDLEKELPQIEDLWKNVINSKNSQDYLALKKRMTTLINSLELLIKDEKALAKDLKKYKAK